MDRKRLMLGVLPIISVAVLLAVFYQLGALADETGTRSPADYVGSDSCQTCHAASYAGWSATLHPDAWENLSTDPLKVEECEKCHVTGHGDVAHGGFDPTNDSPVSMRGIQCEACHGPGSDHVITEKPEDIQMSYSAAVCGAICHQEEHHPYFEEWNQSGHSMSLVSLKGATGAAEDSCLECHSADYVLANITSKPTIQSAEYAVTCALCHDPHNAVNPNQLRWPKDELCNRCHNPDAELRWPKDELCNRCHNPDAAIPGDPIFHPQSSMRDGRSGAPILGEAFMPDVECADCHVYMDMSNNITGHSFAQKPEACVVCHSTDPPIYSPELAQAQIAQWRAETWTRIIEVQEKVVLAKGSIEDAPSYGFSESTIQIAAGFYDEANYSLAFVVADGSGGAHNPAFVNDLLNFSEERSGDLITLLTPGTITGRAVDTMGNPVEGVTIEKDGRVWATSRSNGSFQFQFAPGTHSFDLRLRGSHVGSIGSVSVASQEVSDVGDVEIIEENLLVPILISLGAIIMLSLIVIYLLFKKKGTGPKEEDL